MNKPPLGITPRRVHDEHRLIAIVDAMFRYSEVEKDIPKVWYAELHEIANRRTCLQKQ